VTLAPTPTETATSKTRKDPTRTREHLQSFPLENGRVFRPKTNDSELVRVYFFYLSPFHVVKRVFTWI